MREDFSPTVKEILARRVGMRCANPKCRKPTSGPRDDQAQAVNIGVAAHITAASPGGPRYDNSLSPEERKSATNGIWLCQNCAKLVDNDEHRYTVNILRHWKDQSEEAARQALEANTPSAQGTPHFPLPPPQMQIISPSHFGRLGSKGGRFALLLQVKFRNESAQPLLLQHFRIQYADSWHAPHLHHSSFILYASSRQFAGTLRKEDDITGSLRIPEMAEIKRHTFFILPDPPEPFPGPERLHLTAEARFAQRSPQEIAFMLTDRGEIEQESGTGNQEDT